MEHLRILMIGPGQPTAANSGVGIVVNSIEQELSKRTALTVIQPDEIEKVQTEKVESVSARFSDTRVVQDLIRISVHSTIDPYLYLEEGQPQSVKTEKQTQSIQHELIAYSDKVVEKAQELNFDVIYAHDWIAVQAGLSIQELTGKPLVYHVHSLHVDRVSLQDKSWVYELEKTAIAKADAIIAVSKYTAERIVKYYAGNSQKITVVYPAAPEINPFESGVSPTDPTVLFLGRFARQKAPANFLKIASKMLQKRSDIHFLMVGDGDQRAELIEIAAQQKLSGNVHFEEYIDHRSIGKVFERATVLCIPSVSEPFGLTALEAALYGLPVVVSTQSGVREVLPGAITVDFDDIDGFAGKIEKLLSDKDFAAKAIARNKQSVNAMSWQQVGREIEQLLRATANK